MLAVLAEMLEWLEREFNLEPPWRCDLCNSESPAAAATCFVCESPKGHQTIKGRAAKCGGCAAVCAAGCVPAGPLTAFFTRLKLLLP